MYTSVLVYMNSDNVYFNYYPPAWTRYQEKNIAELSPAIGLVLIGQ